MLSGRRPIGVSVNKNVCLTQDTSRGSFISLFRGLAGSLKIPICLFFMRAPSHTSLPPVSGLWLHSNPPSSHSLPFVPGSSHNSSHAHTHACLPRLSHSHSQHWEKTLCVCLCYTSLLMSIIYEEGYKTKSFPWKKYVMVTWEKWLS